MGGEELWEGGGGGGEAETVSLGFRVQDPGCRVQLRRLEDADASLRLPRFFEVDMLGAR